MTAWLKKQLQILKFWLWNILLAFDQLGNALFMGDPAETISRRAGQAAEQGQKWACILCNLLSYIDPRHCMTAQQRADEGDGDSSVAALINRWETGQSPNITG